MNLLKVVGIALPALIGTSLTAAADTVRLTNGCLLEGVAREEADRIVVEINIGTVTFSKNEVESIRKNPTILHQYLDRFALIGKSANADEVLQFVQWAEGNGITRDRSELLKRLIAIDPDHAWARKRLGFESYDGKWMTREEILKSKGFVLFEGKWVTAAEKEIVLGKRSEAKLKSQMAAMEEAAKRREEKKQKQEELRQRAEEELWIRQQLTASRYYRERYRRSTIDYPWWQVYEPYGSYIRSWGATSLYYPYSYRPYAYPSYGARCQPIIYTTGTILTPEEYKKSLK
ncbi:MAG: hypothetical protein A2Z34_07755 [Planctomycetes bacterium RBG_16_59_8]|nr:MAG: hypothetical protein A2Z34_07755 [Planctomycetes bacterium RBG_16_59_8]